MKNWKTTLCGFAIAALEAINNYQGHGNWKGYVSAGLIAGFGVLVKDFNVGG